MILKSNNQEPIKPTKQNNYNNAIDDIKKMMETAKDPWKQKNITDETPKPNFDPNKQRETMIKMEKLNGGSR